jgi:phosphomethylpyrimidine synthase
MKISQEVREFAAQQGLDDAAALDHGMQAKSAEFREGGSEIYIPIQKL